MITLTSGWMNFFAATPASVAAQRPEAGRSAS